jgi:O-antigen ligase
MAKQRLFLGHGFGGFWTAETIAYQGVNSVHNGYLEVILHLGFVGLILVSVFLVSSCRRAQGIMKWDFYGASLWLGLLLMTILHNMGESSLDSFSRPLTGMLVLLYVAFSPIIKDHKKSDGDDLSEG